MRLSLSLRRKALLLAISSLAALLLTAALFPLPEAIRHPEELAPVRILDRSGHLLYEVRQSGHGLEKPLTLFDVPEEAIHALIAIEDRTFSSHWGVSLRGIARAALENIRAGRIVSGGSTITQQLVRLRLRPEKRTVLWKLRELFLALKVDALMSKDGILEAYLQSAYFGHQAYGLRSAAHAYFGKEPKELSIAEIALLVGLLKSPVALDPYEHRSASLERRRIVLGALQTEGVIAEKEEERSREEPLHLRPDRIAIEAPHFTFFVLSRLGEKVKPGEEVKTTLDRSLQRETEEIVDRRMEELRRKNATSAAVVVLDAHNGDILAMIGSADYFDSSHDGAVNVAVSPRQPGSSLKPFTYALALSKGDTAAATVADTDLQLLTEDGNPYTPRNYDYDLHGLVRYREALANSYNIAAVKVLERIGVAALHAFLAEAGVTTLTENPEHYGLALTLGSGEVKLLELAEAYGIFPRGGRTLEARALLEEEIAEGKEILDPRIAWIIGDILSDASARLPEFGEDTPLALPPHTVAAKTGTTRNARDNWIVGFTEDRIVGVWVGNADNTPMRDTSGVTGAGPIFHDVMEAALRGIEPAPFPRPAGIEKAAICALSGKLPTPACKERVEEFFLEGTAPKESDDLHALVSIDARNGLRAGKGCDEKFVREEIFTVFPLEVQAWARERGYRTAPGAFSPLCPGMQEAAPPEQGALVITKPHDGDSFLLDPIIPDRDERIMLEARAPQGIMEAEWSVDGTPLGKSAAPDFRMQWNPSPGIHRIRIQAGNADSLITITVSTPTAPPAFPPSRPSQPSGDSPAPQN